MRIMSKTCYEKPMKPHEMARAIDRGDEIVSRAMRQTVVSLTAWDFNEALLAGGQALGRMLELEAENEQLRLRVKELEEERDLRDFQAALAAGGVSEVVVVSDPATSDRPDTSDSPAVVEESPAVLAASPPVLEPEPENPERAWLAGRGLDVSTAILFVKHRVECQDDRRMAAVADQFEISEDDALAMGRRYGPFIGKMRDARGKKREDLMSEFTARFGVAA